MEASQSVFDDALHQLFQHGRIHSDEDVAGFRALLDQVLEQIESENPSKWKSLLLSLIYKRYHHLSPLSKQLQHQRAGLFVEFVIFAGVGGQGAEPVAHVDIALAQHADLLFHQGDRAAGSVGYVQVVQHVGVALQEVPVLFEVIPYLLVTEFR